MREYLCYIERTNQELSATSVHYFLRDKENGDTTHDILASLGQLILVVAFTQAGAMIFLLPPAMSRHMARPVHIISGFSCRSCIVQHT